MRVVVVEEVRKRDLSQGCSRDVGSWAGEVEMGSGAKTYPTTAI
jgi:hypothetical protein